MDKAKLDTMVSETQAVMAKAVDAVKGSQTKGDAMVSSLARAFLPIDDPTRLFMEWLSANSGRLREAVAELGLDIPEGPGYANRLRDAVAKELERRQWRY